MTEPIKTNAARPEGLFPMILAVVAGVSTGVLWAYANPIQLVPGVIQWRIFAFLPPLVGLLLGPRSGFVCGYVGTVVWGLLAGTFIPLHSLLVDGIMVALTGAVPPMVVNLHSLGFKVSRSALAKIALISVLMGVAMVAAVSASLSFLGIFPFWFAMFYLGLSDIIPMVLGVTLLIRPSIRILTAVSRGVLRRF